MLPHTETQDKMNMAAFEEYQPDIHGHYEHWELPARESGDEDSGSDCEDDLMRVDPAEGKEVLKVKIPKHLIERWSAIDEEDVHLATIRYYRGAPSSADPDAPPKPRAVLTLPADADDDRLGPEEYEMEITPVMPATLAFTEYIVAEYDSHAAVAVPAPSAAAPGRVKKGAADAQKHRKRRRRVALAGAVTHHCSLRVVLNERTRQRVKARSVAANTPKRHVIYLGAGVRPPQGAAVAAANKPFLAPAGCATAMGAADRMTRAPRNKLLDMLFRLFADRPRWSLKQLRENTQQPEAYLREVLPEIANLHRVGEFHGLWELTASYGGRQVKDTSVASTPGPSEAEPAAVDIEDEGENDSDDDLEEVI